MGICLSKEIAIPKRPVASLNIDSSTSLYYALHEDKCQVTVRSLGE